MTGRKLVGVLAVLSAPVHETHSFPEVMTCMDTNLDEQRTASGQVELDDDCLLTIMSFLSPLPDLISLSKACRVRPTYCTVIPSQH